MILTLFVTILVEGIIVSAYAIWRRKPLGSILLTSILANLITQFILWLALNMFFQQYLVSLIVAEVFIWILESLLLYLIPANQLRLQEATFLSFFMNLISFVVGWFLPL